MTARRHPASFAACGLLAALLTHAAFAQPVAVEPLGDIRITIRKDGAVVRERVAARFSGSESTLTFPNIPRETDPSTISVRSPYNNIQLRHWGRHSYARTNGISATAAGRGVRIEFNKPVRFEGGDLQAVMASSRPGRQEFDLIYAITGMVWRSGYDVLLRGDLAQIDRRLSMDAEGWIEVENFTGREYPDARITVIGEDTQGEERQDAVIDEPGILELDDDSPLADLWRDLPEEPRTPYVYPLDRPVTIPVAGSVRITHLSVIRKPVQRLLVVRAEEIPTDTFTQFAKPSQLIAFRNESEDGRKRALPPGPSLIHVGNQRSFINQKAWFNHTPADSEIRIDMGKVEGIRSRRVNRSQAEIPGGGYEQTFEVRIENRLASDVTVVVDEEPPVFNLAWRLVRANRPHTVQGRRLIFDVDVEAESEAMIQYTVRYSIPRR